MPVDPSAATAAISEIIGLKPAPKEANPANPEKSESDGQPRLLAGKWKTEEELNKGVHNLIAHANAQETRANQLAAELAALRSKPGDDAVAKFSEESGVAADQATAAIRSVAVQVLQEMIAPAVKAATADQELTKTYGSDYLKALPQVQIYLAENPQVARLANEAVESGNPMLGKAYAYEMYMKDKAALDERAKLDADADARREIERTRADAGTTARRHSAGARDRATGAAGLTSEQIAQIVEQAQRGDYRLFDKYIMRPTLPPEEVLQRMISNVG